MAAISSSSMVFPGRCGSVDGMGSLHTFLVLRDDYYILPGSILSLPTLREAVQFQRMASPGHGFCSAMRALRTAEICELGPGAKLTLHLALTRMGRLSGAPISGQSARNRERSSRI